MFSPSGEPSSSSIATFSAEATLQHPAGASCSDVVEWLDKVAPEDKVLKRFEALRNGEVLFKKEVE